MTTRMLTSRMENDLSWEVNVENYLARREGKDLAVGIVYRDKDGREVATEPVNLHFTGFDHKGRALFAVALSDIHSLDDEHY